MERTARAIVASIPDEAAQAMTIPGDSDVGEEVGFADAFFTDFAPEQAAAVRRTIELLKERAT